MFLTILLVIARLFASLYLFTAGVLLLFEDQSRKSVVLWGAGLVVWSSAVLVSLFSFSEGSEVSMAFFALMRLILLISFVFMLMRGTLGLLIPARETTIFIILYGLIILVLDFTINMVSGSQYDNLAVHSIYLTLPVTIVFFSYFYTYYIQLRDKALFRISLSWGLLFTLTLLYIVANSLQIDFLERLFMLLGYIITIVIAFSFDWMRKSSKSWDVVTMPKGYVIDTSLVRFLEEAGKGADSKNIVQNEISKSGYESIRNMPQDQQKIFIGNLVESHFPEHSAQKKTFLKSKMMSALGIRSG